MVLSLSCWRCRAGIGGEWDDDDYDVLADGVVVGRIMETAAAPVGQPWMWTLAFGHHEDRTPTHGYAESREAAMAAFAMSWRRKRSLEQFAGAGLREHYQLMDCTHSGI
jgi:hypothetical protein